MFLLSIPTMAVAQLPYPITAYLALFPIFISIIIRYEQTCNKFL